jgi:A/G-specific adenine glycosylase
MKAHTNDGSEKRKGFQRNLLRWFHKNQRSLPWRINPAPYRVWISEVMLQQTQVKTVIPYYDRFLKAFPDLESLSRASEQKVLELWSGLGYYRRGRDLLKTAKQIVKEHGIFPSEFKTILALPGIGRYTAGAICSIAFNQAQPIVDGNIRRVLIRLNGIKGRLSEKYFWDQMSVLIPENKASSFNQAMMELGALICTPLQPHCSRCPVAPFCEAKQWGIQAIIPKARAKTAIKQRSIAILVLKKGARILLAPLNKHPFIPGEWGLPSLLTSNKESAKQTASLLCRSIFGHDIPLTLYAQIRHSISNYRIIAYAFCGKPDSGAQPLKSIHKHCWLNYSQNKTRLTSSLFRKVLQQYEELGLAAGIEI